MVIKGKALTEEKLRTYWGKVVRIVTVYGDTYEGEVDFTSSADNDPEEACLTVIELAMDIGLSEIETIEIIK